MSALRILFIGGTGTIGSARVPCVRGGTSAHRRQPGHHCEVCCGVPAGVELLRLDVRDRAAARSVIGGREFDVVVNSAGCTADQVEFDAELFAGRIRQYGPTSAPAPWLSMAPWWAA